VPIVPPAANAAGEESAKTATAKIAATKPLSDAQKLRARERLTATAPTIGDTSKKGSRKLAKIKPKDSYL
jgi:hypothetical protein